jgi:nitrate/nitrite transport system substrate-binding protein
MSIFDNPFDADRTLSRSCTCGQHRAVDGAVLRALFPNDVTRRHFLNTVGQATAMAAIAQVFPLAVAREAFAETGALEKQKLALGFIPITCATPIIMAHPMGFYSKYGLDVDVIKTAGWAVIRDKTINKEYDAAHMLSPMQSARGRPERVSAANRRQARPTFRTRHCRHRPWLGLNHHRTPKRTTRRDR